jgi:Mlc titration factor MtfA (ptsG expression regulator)
MIYLLIFAGLLLVGVRFYSVVREGFGLIRESVYKSGKVNYSAEVTNDVSIYLLSFSYYQKLSSIRKEEFIRRTLNFLNTKNISGEDDFEPSYEAKVHVAAAATQLAFGLPDFSFSHFDDVILYPAIFKIGEHSPLMKGATTPDGVIRISMKDFEDGYKNPNDKLNVGLHELGHALFMEFLKQVSDEKSEEEQPEISVTHVVYPYFVESDKILKEGKQHTHFLREYAFANRHEFFAVCMEHFFEAPAEFKEKLPELFTVLTHLLNQDPGNFAKDYAVN